MSDQKLIFLDGAMGTVLQSQNQPVGEIPEILNITDPARIEAVHRAYVEAGSQVVYANTFGANPFKLAGTGYAVKEVVGAGVQAARRAAGGKARVALDIGPLGQLLEPLGTLTFEAACEAFREIVLAGAEADLIVIETMADLYEAKAALLAAKENADKPVLVTMSFEENGRTYAGCTPESMARTLTALGADGIGLNCSLGPEGLAPLVEQVARATYLPVIAKPNAGLPDPLTGTYSMDPADFARAMEACIAAGATIVGGCCGTTPEYIAALKNSCRRLPLPERRYIRKSFLCTPSCPLTVDGVRVIGERINPTGKKRFQQALLEKDLDYILQIGLQQMDAGAEILDVNVGYPGVDEAEMLSLVVKKLQSALPIPLQLDSSEPAALEAGLRVYNGKPAVNSVNGKKEVQERILPIVKKYGAAVVGLTLESGIPADSGERVALAKEILAAARAAGIPDEDLWIDCLTLTVSAQPEQARETLSAVRRVKEELGLKTVLGVSNISFGMPSRVLINRTFLAEALSAGLDLAIINPNSNELIDTVRAHRVLSGQDDKAAEYVARYGGEAPAAPEPAREEMTLEQAVMRGLEAEAARAAKAAIRTESGLDIVQNRLIPALDAVGEQYEKGVLFLPQLLASAQAAQAVFEVIRATMTAGTLTKGRLLMATVRGDIHDIGKNIVKTVLENYGYEVIDLGKDVPPEAIARAAREQGIRLVGLSALMTTTLPAMEETIRLLKALPAPPSVMVGGAVVTADYAERIGADYYARDARGAVEAARKVLG